MKNSINSINIEVSSQDLSIALDKVIREIKRRITFSFGVTDYEMAIIASTNQKICNNEEVPIVIDNNIPDNLVFVICKSVGCHEIIKPRNGISWEQFYQMASGEQPAISISAMHLQARITVADETERII